MEEEYSTDYLLLRFTCNHGSIKRITMLRSFIGAINMYLYRHKSQLRVELYHKCFR
jgi:hypothetical protein